MKILICGDSFSADWTKKYEGIGWPNMLEQKFEVMNLSQAGCSEYKIYLQLCSVDLQKYDVFLISHTSPNRIYVKKHPVHSNDPLHNNSDLIYQDILEHSKTNKSLSSIVDFYENYFDLEYFKFTHGLICQEIEKMLYDQGKPTLHLTHQPWNDLYQFSNMLQFENLFKSNKGLMNHYDFEGNTFVYNEIVKNLTKLAPLERFELP